MENNAMAMVIKSIKMTNDSLRNTFYDAQGKATELEYNKCKEADLLDPLVYIISFVGEIKGKIYGAVPFGLTMTEFANDQINKLELHLNMVTANAEICIKGRISQLDFADTHRHIVALGKSVEILGKAIDAI